MDFKNYIVPKPWGYEYLIFENERIGIWWLHLQANARTSLHCHPDKKTGLILLDGNAKVTFLSDSIPLFEFSKVMIREGVFHSTQALSPDGIDVLEIETPKDKENLVRMEDVYGRRGKHYESIAECAPRNDSTLWIKDEISEKVTYAGYQFCVERLNLSTLATLTDNDIIVILSMVGIISKDGFAISKGGDAIKVSVVRRLVSDFLFSSSAYALVIRSLR